MLIADDPYRAKWLNERDRTIVIARLKQNNAGIVNRQLKRYQIWEALKDFNMWSNTFMVGAVGIPNAVFSSFSTPVIEGLGFSNLNALLLLMPMGFSAVVSVWGTGWFTRHFDGWRYYMIILTCLVAFAGALMQRSE